MLTCDKKKYEQLTKAMNEAGKKFDKLTDDILPDEGFSEKMRALIKRMKQNKEKSEKNFIELEKLAEDIKRGL